MTKFSKNFFLLLIICQHVADVVVKSYSSATCVKGVGRDWTALQSINIEEIWTRKIALLKIFNFAPSNEPNSHSFWATRLILVPKEAEVCSLQSNREFFFQISNSEKSYAVWSFSFLGNNVIFWKKLYYSKTKMKFEKKLCVVL